MRRGSVNQLSGNLRRHLTDRISLETRYGELTARLPSADLPAAALLLRDQSDLSFDQLIDLCGVDNSEFGVSEWDTSTSATHSGFSRAVESAVGARRQFDPSDRRAEDTNHDQQEALGDRDHRFWVVYHLLSHKHNWRLRLKVPALNQDGLHLVDSVCSVWRSADWYEREAFDLYGIHFRNHPDLRRLLTDYGFIGYPMRKDFPLIGEVEVRYDQQQQRVIQQPVSIEPRVLVPKVISPANRQALADEQQNTPESGGA